MTIIREAARLGDQELIIETGRMAKQANGSVMVQYGNSQVLCLATGGGIREGWTSSRCPWTTSRTTGPRA